MRGVVLKVPSSTSFVSYMTSPNPVLPLTTLLAMGSVNGLIKPCTFLDSRKQKWASCLPHLIFCYNPAPHQSTGKSSFFLMSGCDPQLPVDFLLGRVLEPKVGTVHDWVQEHQGRLQVTFDSAKEQLTTAARRKKCHDHCVKEDLLPEGLHVYVQDHGVREHHKIHDLWDPTVHQVLKTPQSGGAVYMVAPLNHLSRVRHVHRTRLKS